MARGEDRKAALIAELARARARIDGASSNVRAQLDVRARVQRTVSRNLWWWVGGAVLVGVVFAQLRPRTEKVYVDAKGGKVRGSKAATTGAAFAVAKLAFDLARPMLTKWVTGNVADYVRKKSGRESGRV
jgi:hypothetical protein